MKGEDSFGALKRSHELDACCHSYIKLHQPSNQLELTCKSRHWGFRCSTEPSPMRLFPATICRKTMSLCAKENQKSFEQKSNTSSSAILPKAMPEPQLGPPGPPVLHAWLHDTGLAKQGLEEALEVYQDTWICYQQVQAKKWKQMKISSASQKWRLSCVELRWVLRPVVTIRSIMIDNDYRGF